MNDLAPGQLVVCINDSFSAKEHRFIPHTPRCGAVYRIRGLYLDGGRGPGVWLNEIVNPLINVRFYAGVVRSVEPAFLVARFRPVDDSALDVFRAMLEPKRRHENV